MNRRLAMLSGVLVSLFGGYLATRSSAVVSAAGANVPSIAGARGRAPVPTSVNGAALSPNQVTTKTLLADAGYVDDMHARVAAAINVLADGGYFDTLVARLARATTANVTFIDGGSGLIGGVYLTGTNVSTPGGFVSTGGTGTNAFTTNGGQVCLDTPCGANIVETGSVVAIRSAVTNIGTFDTGTGNFTVPIGYTNNTDTSANGGYRLASKLVMTGAAPTITGGFGGSPSIASNNGSTAFTINVGSGGTATSGTIGLTSTGVAVEWICGCNDVAAAIGLTDTRQSGSLSTSGCTLTNVNTATGVAAAWPANEILHCHAHPL